MMFLFWCRMNGHQKRYFNRLALCIFCNIMTSQVVASQVLISRENTLNKSLEFPPMEKNDSGVILGALFPIHSEASTPEGQMCGSLQGEDGILPLEALVFTLEQINRNKKLLPGIKLGVIAVDSCNSNQVALQQSLRFMKGFLASQSLHHDFRCSDGSELVYESGKYNNVVGVIGGQRSSVSVQMASVFTLFSIPQISYRSTSSSLSDTKRYPYFLRTVPADTNQVKVILKILELLNVSYASVVYSDTEYGSEGYKQLQAKTKNSSVCFALPHFAVRVDDPSDVYKNIVHKLMKRKKANVVVLFAHKETAVKLLSAVKALADTYPGRRLLWVGSDAWTSHSTALNEFSDFIEGSIGVQPLAKELPGFQNYFTNLTPDNNKRNPWFREYWENHFSCSLDSDPECEKQSLRDEKDYINLTWLHFVRDSVYAFAHALHDMWKDHCGGEEGVCSNMTHEDHIHGDEFYKYLKNVSFQDISNHEFTFESCGDGIPRYTIFVYKKPQSRETPWIPIANYTYNSTTTEFNFIGNIDTFPYIPESSCSRPCLVNEAKITSSDDVCCWQCESCTQNQFLNSTTNFCETCDRCYKPDGAQCVKKEMKYFDLRNQWAITSMAFASLGIISTIFVGIIFWVHLDTPVIKAASRELSYILLGGILLSFCMTFILLSPPSFLSCGISRFCLGLTYTVCYSAILTKTNRIHRIFKNPGKATKAKYTSPTSQMVIVSLLVAMEIIILVSWLIYYKSDVKELCSPNRDYNFLICKGTDDYSYLVGFIYPFFLLCLCTTYAIKTRKCPDGFNEARYIAFTNYTTCILWLIFIPLYLTIPAQEGVRLVSLAISLSLNAFVQLGCLFFPKVHICLFKPKKNTRDYIMSQTRNSSQNRQNSNFKAPHSAPANFVPNDGGKRDSMSMYPTGGEEAGRSKPSNSLPPNSHLHVGSIGERNNPPKEQGQHNPLYLSVPGRKKSQEK